MSNNTIATSITYIHQSKEGGTTNTATIEYRKENCYSIKMIYKKDENR